jgi:hypothetical protein
MLKAVTAKAQGRTQDLAVAVALSGVWIGLVGAHLFGNYPAPVIGYGASLVIGWLASLGFCLQRQRPPQTPPSWTLSPRVR